MQNSLSQRCGRRFDPTTKSHGIGFFEDGLVTYKAEEGKTWKFEVKDSAYFPYQVSISISDSNTSISTTCDCPDSKAGDACKHIWSAILVSDQKGLSLKIPGKHPLFVFCNESQNVDGTESDETEVQVSEDPELEVSTEDVNDQYLRSRWRKTIQKKDFMAVEGEEVDNSPKEIWYLLDQKPGQLSNRLKLRMKYRQLLKSGEWSRIKELVLREADLQKMASESERKILSVLMDTCSASAHYAAFYKEHKEFEVPTSLLETLFPALCETGRFAWMQEANLNDTPYVPLVWDPKLTPSNLWQFVVGVRKVAYGNIIVEGWLTRENETLALNQIKQLHGNILFYDNVISMIRPTKYLNWLNDIRENGPIIISASEETDFIKELVKLGEFPLAKWPQDLNWDRVESAGAKIRLIFTPESRQGAGTFTFELMFDYEGYSVSSKNPSSAVLDGKSKRILFRNAEFEKSALAELLEEVKATNAAEKFNWPDKLTSVGLVSVATKFLAKGWSTEVEGRKMRPAGEATCKVSTGITWFDLDIKLKFGDQVANIHEILEELQSGRKLVRLKDGSVGVIPDEWLKKLDLLKGMGDKNEQSLRLGRAQLSLLDQFIEHLPDASMDKTFIKLRDKLKCFAGIKEMEPAKTFKGKLREYQKEGISWLSFLDDFTFGGCLADDMGLGKTIQVLAFLDRKREETKSPTLIVVPRSLVHNWVAEAKQFTPKLKLDVLDGPDRDVIYKRLGKADVVITTYGILRLDIEKLIKVDFERVILDEAQAIKNRTSQASKAARMLKSKYRLALTGTPVENHIGELWSLFDFLNPGMLGSASAFESRDPEQMDRLQRTLKPFVLRRTKEKVLKELPKKTEQILYCEMDTKQRQYYDELRNFYLGSLKGKIKTLGMDKAKMHVLEALLRLRQVSCHPGLVAQDKMDLGSTKMDLLVPMLEDLVKEKNRKVLVFSQFTSLLALVKDKLEEFKIPYDYLDGATRNRAHVVNQFKENDKAGIFLISLKAGGVGLNLVEADYVFILDPWWNPAVEAQAIDRAHRIGQKNPVFAYKVICKDTVEEKIVMLQQQKKTLVDSLFAPGGTSLKALKAEDIEFLLG